MRNIDMGASGNAASLIWEAIENGLLAKRRIVHDAPPPQSDQDAETFCEAVVAFFRSYAKTQGYLPDFVQTTNIDPERLGLVSRWLEADKECLRALKRLQIQFPNRTAQLAESLTATARGLNTASLSALVTKSALPPVSERDRQLAEQERPESEVRLEITNVLFDPNGLTEMYIVFDLRNPSTPTTVKNWRLAVRDSDKMILAEQAPRVVHTRTRFRGPREIHETENLAETPLEQGGERHGCRLVYSFLRNVAVDLFDKPGARFKVTAEDVHGNQIAASFTRGS